MVTEKHSTPPTDDRLFPRNALHLPDTADIFLIYSIHLVLPVGSRIIICVIQDMFAGIALCCTDPVPHLVTAGYDLDGLDRDLSDLSDLS